jgi:hypothetical protein
MSNTERALDVSRRDRSARPFVVAQSGHSLDGTDCAAFGLYHWPCSAGSCHPETGLLQFLARAGEPD